MSWVKLTKDEDRSTVWVNMRTHDFMERDEDTNVTRICLHDGDYLRVLETPDEILAKLGNEQ